MFTWRKYFSILLRNAKRAAVQCLPKSINFFLAWPCLLGLSIDFADLDVLYNVGNPRTFGSSVTVSITLPFCFSAFDSLSKRPLNWPSFWFCTPGFSRRHDCRTKLFLAYRALLLSVFFLFAMRKCNIIMDFLAS